MKNVQPVTASHVEPTQFSRHLSTAGLASGGVQSRGEEKRVHQQRLLEALVLRSGHHAGQQALVVGQVLEVQHARHVHQVGVAPVLVGRPRPDPNQSRHTGDQQHPVQVHLGQHRYCLGHQTAGRYEQGGCQHPFVHPVHLQSAVRENHLQVVDRDLFEGLQQKLGVLLQADGHHHTLVVLHCGLHRNLKNAVQHSPEETGLWLGLLATQDPEAKNVVPVWVDADLNCCKKNSRQ